MSTADETPKCPPCVECGGATHPIIVLEAGEGNRHRCLEFTTTDAKPGWFLGRYPTKGYVSAELCVQCGRITLRAYPKATE